MPATIDTTDGVLVVQIEGADKLWAQKSRLEVLLTNVQSAASASKEARKRWHGFRVGGTDIPGVVSTGRFYSRGKWVFWDVRDPEKAIAINLRDERYDRLVTGGRRSRQGDRSRPRGQVPRRRR